MKRMVVVVALFALVGSVALVAQQTGRDGRGKKAEAFQRGTGLVPEVVGTIQYDPGAPEDFFRTFDGTNRSIGNRFSSANGSPLQTGTVTAVSFFPQAVGGDVIVSFWGAPNTGAGTAPFITFATVGGVVSSVFNVAFFNVPVGPDFMAGLYVGTFGSGPDAMGMRNATYAGQGFHGMQINFIGGTFGTGFQSLASTNAMFRASGDLLVPVELMDFTIE